MNTEINDGGPAFPIPESDYEDGRTGMTLRDYFAGQALAGILAGPIASQCRGGEAAETAPGPASERGAAEEVRLHLSQLQGQWWCGRGERGGPEDPHLPLPGLREDLREDLSLAGPSAGARG